MKQRIEFAQFEEARIHASLFFERTLSELDITERTYYRWKSNDAVPYWAMRIIELLSGDLTHLGWNEWELKKGLLFHKGLNGIYNNWSPAQILVTAYCTCPAHNEIRKIRHSEPANESNLGKFQLTGP